MQTAKRIHHIALLVDDIESSILLWKDILGIEPSRISDVPTEAARIAFLPLGESEIELVQPTTTDSGLTAHLKAKGIQLINEEPKVGEEGKLFTFIHPKSTHGVLVELYQIPK